MRYPQKIREEELKNRVAVDFFGKYDCTDIIRDIDFAVKADVRAGLKPALTTYLLWAEAKSAPSDILVMLTQLVLTIGKARTFNEVLPPKFLGCFDCEKIAFIPYADIQDIFHQNDFNWKAAPSNRDSKEFKQVHSQIDKIINSGEQHRTYCFNFSDENSLKLFILKNFMVGKSDVSKIRIDKNNFISVYSKWLEAVKPTIDINWEIAKKYQIIDGYFYLADLISRENLSIKEKLNVLLKKDHYELEKRIDEMGLFSFKTTGFTDKQKAHNAFWAIYERPPRKDYWDYIVERQDLLVPQDVRERKGSFFTPKIWVELSQKYIADTLGEDWQEEYYVWDCAAGTGNLLTGLTNKYNIWASTIDKADVDVMHDRIENGANLLKDHCFQFDFLNDDFSKLPEGLKQIIDDPKKRKKLVIYINPPYAEVSSIIGKGKVGVNKSKIHDKYISELGTAGREIYTQFMVRIYNEISNCKIGEFSKLKTLQGSAFENFRMFFQAKLKKMFIVPADTFDNVNGQFPIGFKIWDTNKKEKFEQIIADVFDSSGKSTGNKSFYSYDKKEYINKWISSFKSNFAENIGFLAGTNGNDFQHNNIVYILNNKEQMPNPRGTWINQYNLIPACIYLAVRHCVDATWLNDRDQFLYPNDGWEADLEFQNDCIAYTLFHGQNNISCKHGINHWIPFTEWDVDAKDKFKSHFMTDFIHKEEFYLREPPSIFYNCGTGGGGIGKNTLRTKTRLIFSKPAKNVFIAGLKLWKYYHAQPKCNVNASLYDIREHFQGRNTQGKMNNKSDDETYNELVGNLRDKMKVLAKKIEPKVYEYGFLRE